TRSKPDAVLAHGRAYPPFSSVDAADDSGSIRARLGDGVGVAVDVAARREAALALFSATGSREHVARVRELAAAQGLELTDRTLSRRTAPRSPIAVATEAELYEQLGLAYVPPELRDGGDELEAASAGAIPADLVTVEDVRGLVHCHTTYSDGVNSVLEMARAADEMGM